MSELIFNGWSSAVVAWIVAGSIAFVLHYRRTMSGNWREPVLRKPVLIVESDDWGVGPASDAEALASIEEVLKGHLDRNGRHPVMTLGVVLAQPDRRAMRDEPGIYHASTMAEPVYEPIRRSMLDGEALSLFSLQLHGMEHYWPPALMAAAGTDSDVAAWLRDESDPPATSLPDALQSRWIDAAQLPSKALANGDVDAAVRAETACFGEVFGRAPDIVVPPTFVWTETVERAWSEADVDAIVTPGRRHVGRDAEGRLVSDLADLYNGRMAGSGVLYLVRDDYFEPSIGHGVDRAIEALHNKSQCGRPTLLESHRFNYVGERSGESLDVLDALYRTAMQSYPEVIFMSTTELAEAYRRNDPELVDPSLTTRLYTWFSRMMLVPGFMKKAIISGAFIPLGLLMLPLEILHDLKQRIRRDRG